MYKLYHWLFGWDYIVWRNTATAGLSRVLVSPDGQPYYFLYKSCYYKMLLTPDTIKQYEIIFLTCKQSKYIKEL